MYESFFCAEQTISDVVDAIITWWNPIPTFTAPVKQKFQMLKWFHYLMFAITATPKVSLNQNQIFNSADKWNEQEFF